MVSELVCAWEVSRQGVPCPHHTHITLNKGIWMLAAEPRGLNMEIEQQQKSHTTLNFSYAFLLPLFCVTNKYNFSRRPKNLILFLLCNVGHKQAKNVLCKLVCLLFIPFSFFSASQRFSRNQGKGGSRLKIKYSSAFGPAAC